MKGDTRSVDESLFSIGLHGFGVFFLPLGSLNPKPRRRNPKSWTKRAVAFIGLLSGSACWGVSLEVSRGVTNSELKP